MKSELKEAALDVFKKCTPEERYEAFALMSSLISARDIEYVCYAPDEKIRTVDLLRVFSACLFEERKQVVSFIIDKWVEREQETLRLCKADHKQLDSLPVETLRAVASWQQEQAHQKIVTSFPGVAGLLCELEGLMAFKAKSEPTVNDLEDVKGSIVYVWEWEPITTAKAAAPRQGKKTKRAGVMKA